MRKNKIAGMVTALVLTAAMLTGCGLPHAGTPFYSGKPAKQGVFAPCAREKSGRRKRLHGFQNLFSK